MNQLQLRVIEGATRISPQGVLTPGEQIEAFFGAPLPSEFSVPDGASIQRLDKPALESLMLERGPFFFIERAVAVGGETLWAVAEMSVEKSAGHFPGRPIVPLIELCKAMAQTGIALVALQGNSDEAPIAIQAGESKALAKELIDAPARIVMRVALTQSRFHLFFVDGVAYLDGKKIGSLNKIVYTLVDRQQLLQRPA